MARWPTSTASTSTGASIKPETESRAVERSHSMIDESGDLTIGAESGSDAPTTFVRFSCPARDRVRCEAAGKPILGDDVQLGDGLRTTMESLGWQPPSVSSAPPTRYFWTEAPQEDSQRIAELAVRALRDVFGVLHPVFLAPDQLAEVLQPSPPRIESIRSMPPIEVDHDDLQAQLPRNRSQLDELVDAELAEMYGHPPLRDTEGDVAIRVGSTMLFLRTSPDGQEVIVFAAVVHDVAGRSRAMEVLNDLNVEGALGQVPAHPGPSFRHVVGAGQAVRAGSSPPGRTSGLGCRRRYR